MQAPSRRPSDVQMTSSVSMETSSNEMSNESRVEVSVVGSPEVFGVNLSENVGDSKDEEGEIRQIERCGTSPSQAKARSPEEGALVIDTSSPQLPRNGRPQSAFVDARPSTLSSQDLLYNALRNWQWVSIDGVQIPSILRGSVRYLAVHMIQLKLLSRFPPGIPQEILSKFTMMSHRMTVTEAWVFNSINAVLRKFDLGCQLYTPVDELVMLSDVQMFYWNVKSLNLTRIMSQYENELPSIQGNLAMWSVICQLKLQVEKQLEEVRSELARLESSNPSSSNNTTGTTTANSSAQQVPSSQLNGHSTTASPRPAGIINLSAAAANSTNSSSSPRSTISDSINVFS